tara:strand:+ start:469 stop:681 length:213 start_codon:yes stop_codon:yes gene_type:complete
MNTFDKYKKNLEYDNKYIYSFGTAVAHYDNNFVYPIDWEIEYKGEKLSSSPTTSKHINYATNELNLTLNK